MTIQLSIDDLYLTGIRVVDEQHAQFVRLIACVQSAPVVDESEPSGAELLEELTAYAAYHFQTEENLMRQSGYPDLEPHALEHRRIAGELTQQVDAIIAGRTTKAKLVMFLWKWLVNHTNLDDKAMGAHLSAQGVK